MKRVLSMALALVLALGVAAVGTVGASAAWTDTQHWFYSTEIFKVWEPIDIWMTNLLDLQPGESVDFGDREPPYSGDILYDYDLVAEHFASPSEAIIAFKASYAWVLTMVVEFYGVVAPDELWALCDATPPAAAWTEAEIAAYNIAFGLIWRPITDWVAAEGIGNVEEEDFLPGKSMVEFIEKWEAAAARRRKVDEGAAQNNFDNPAAALTEAKAIYAAFLSLIAEYIGLVAPAELWALCGATPPAAATYTLTYDTRGGTGGPAAQTGIEKGAAVTLSATVPTRAEHTFKGWAATSTSTATITSVTVSANTTVYAVWEKDTVGPAPDKILELLSFLPEGVANVMAAIVRYVFFGWLWGSWL